MSKTSTDEDTLVDELTTYPFDPKDCEEVMIDFDDDVLNELIKMAGRRNISLDHLVNAILHYQLERIEGGLTPVLDETENGDSKV